MRYERASAGWGQSTVRLSPRRRWLVGLVVAGAMAIGTWAAVAGSQSYARVRGSAPAIRAAKAAFLRANLIAQNLGARPPVGTDELKWLEAAHPDSATASVAEESSAWLPSGDRPGFLSATGGAKLYAAQSRVVEAAFAGKARDQTLAVLRQVTGAETGQHPHLAAPGGAKVRNWLRVDVTAKSGHLEADVDVWESTVTLFELPRPHLVATQVRNRLDVLATLRFSGGRWSVIAFNQLPWQQAT